MLLLISSDFFAFALGFADVARHLDADQVRLAEYADQIIDDFAEFILGAHDCRVAQLGDTFALFLLGRTWQHVEYFACRPVPVWKGFTAPIFPFRLGPVDERAETRACFQMRHESAERSGRVGIPTVRQGKFAQPVGLIGRYAEIGDKAIGRVGASASAFLRG